MKKKSDQSAMPYELLVQDAPKWLKHHHPDLYEKTKNIHPLLPMICVMGLDKGKPSLLPPIAFVKQPITVKLVGGQYDVPYDHYYSQEWKNVEKTNAHLKPHLDSAIAHMIICGEDAGFDFLDYFIRFNETPLGLAFSNICSNSYKHRLSPNGHKAYTLFSESTQLEGFLDSLYLWKFPPEATDENDNEEAGIMSLLDPKKVYQEEVWNYLALRLFSSGNPPSREELGDFCKEWVKQSRTVDVSNSVRKLLRSCWITHALWCQTSDSMLKLFPSIEKGSMTEDYDKAINNINMAIRRLGYARHSRHQNIMDKAIRKSEDFTAQVLKDYKS